MKILQKKRSFTGLPGSRFFFLHQEYELDFTEETGRV